jgi:hypothetical protein
MSLFFFVHFKVPDGGLSLNPKQEKMIITEIYFGTVHTIFTSLFFINKQLLHTFCKLIAF